MIDTIDERFNHKTEIYVIKKADSDKKSIVFFKETQCKYLIYKQSHRFERCLLLFTLCKNQTEMFFLKATDILLSFTPNIFAPKVKIYSASEYFFTLLTACAILAIKHN